MSAVMLDRQHFTISQDNRYFDPAKLTAMIGQEQSQWRYAALKELIDNALDAAESVYPPIAPSVEIEFIETDSALILTVADNGDGIPAEAIPRIADLSANSSTKLFYRAPLRGAQGNAIKTLIGMPVALGSDSGQLVIESQGVRHTVTAHLAVTGPKLAFQQTEVESKATRITALIPGGAESQWSPELWLIGYALFNPHARLQIRKIDPVWSAETESETGKHASQLFSDLSFAPTVEFPDPWRKFLPTDPTPAHWYTAHEFKNLVQAVADRCPVMDVADFVQQFKGLSRVWRKAVNAIDGKTMSELAVATDSIAALHRAMKHHATAPKPEVLGRVGKDHFRQRFDDQFSIAQDKKGGDRYWYKHQSGISGDMPYMIEVAVAETERTGGVFYGLNFSVPFADPLASTRMSYSGGAEILEADGLHGLLREAGAVSGIRFGKAINTAVAIHLVMPLLPTLDLGKTRLALPADLIAVIAETVGIAVKVLHKEIIDWRQHQRRREQQLRSMSSIEWRQHQKDREREQRQRQAEQTREEREQRRKERQALQEQQAEQRRLRGELPTKQDVVFNLILPTYMDITEREQIRIAQRDFWYVLYPLYKKIDVRPSIKDSPQSADLAYGHFQTLVADYRRLHHPLPMIDYKARATLYEGHSKREIAFGDRELRRYTLPQHEYAGILFIEKQCVWPSLQDTGIADLANRYDLLIIISEGYATEAVRRLLAQAQEAGMKIMAWHDADPAGYNICRVLGEPTDRMPDHHVDVIDLGLTIGEGLAMGLQTESFVRKKAIPDGILHSLTDEERNLFAGEYDETTGDWLNCQRIEINAIKIRDRVPHLESKIAAVFQTKPTKPGETPAAETRPPIETIHDHADALINRLIDDQIRAAIAERIDLDAIAKLAKNGLQTPPIVDTDLQAAIDADTAVPWRDIVKQYAIAAIDEQQIANVNQAVISAIWESLKGIPRSYEATT